MLGVIERQGGQAGGPRPARTCLDGKPVRIENHRPVQTDDGHAASQIGREGGCRHAPNVLPAFLERAPDDRLAIGTEQAADERGAIGAHERGLADEVGLGHVDEAAQPGLIGVEGGVHIGGEKQ